MAEEALAPNGPKFKRLTDTDKAFAIQYEKDGLHQTEIAQRLGVTQSAISQWLSKCRDTTDSAKLYLRGSSLRMAENIVKRGLPRDHVAALKGIGVLEEQQAQGLTVLVGGEGHNISIALLVQPSASTA